MTEQNRTQLDPSDTAPEDHPSFVDTGAETPEAEDAGTSAEAEASEESAEDASPGTSAEAAAPQTGSGRIPAESGEDYPPESGDTPPQTGLGDSAESAAEPAAAEAGDSTSGDVSSGAGQGGVLGDEDYLPPGQTEVPVGDEVVIDDETMRRALEAILMVTDEPLPVLTLARAVGRPTGDVSAALAALSEEYTEQGRGFDLREVGGGWRYYTRVEAAAYVERFVLDGQQARLTQAALETLAVVAYKQPVSRARVSAIRGVNVDGVMRTLVARGLVEEAGADTESQATLYRTSSYFLERMGMQSLEDLPELAPYLPEMDDIEEELAAQTIPVAAPEDSTSEGTADEPVATEPTDQQEPADPAADAELTEEAEAAGEEPAGVEVDAGDESTDDEVTEAASAEDVPAEELPAEGDTGIDGDLSTDEPVELDLEHHEPGELEPSDEVEPAEADESTADRGQ